jgi:pimeloyl-ACP methyl ester carboxylesterase
VFAARHPAQVRSLVLDSAYPTYGENAWYATQGPAMRTSFDSVCRRTPACARLGSRTTARMSALLTQIRRKPISGKVYGGDGKRHAVILDPSALSYLAFNATYGPVTYRELDAAMRAWLLRRDSAPLLRILAEVYYPGGGTSDPVDYSEGLDAAVSCQDYPQLYDMTQTPAVRRQQYAAAIKQRVATRPNTYGPFRIREYLASDWATQSWCLQWPTAPAAYRQGPIRPPSGRYPASVPVLVLSGELDSITTPAEGAQVARQWPRSRHVVVANSFHVTAYGDVDTCAVTILRSFVTTAKLPDAKVRRCAAVVPPVRATPAFRSASADAPAARALPGSTTSQTRLSAVTTTAETVADLLDRWFQTYEVGGVGLRGGEWVSRGSDVVKFDLDRFQLVRDLAVSGTVRWNRYSHKVTVDLRTFGTTAAGTTIRGSWRNGTLAGSWDGRASGARAVLTGRLGGEPVRAWTPAP